MALVNSSSRRILQGRPISGCKIRKQRENGITYMNVKGQKKKKAKKLVASL